MRRPIRMPRRPQRDSRQAGLTPRADSAEHPAAEGGSVSFLDSEHAPAAPDAAAFHIIPAPMERSVSYGGGARNGPEAILQASRQLEAEDSFGAPGRAGLHTTPPADCDGDAESALSSISDAVRRAIRCGAVPVVLGGEHTVTLGALRALAEEAGRTGEEFGVVQFDAHADLRPSYEDDPLSHACVMHRAVADLRLPLAQFGMREYSREEADLRRTFGVIFHDAADLHRELPERPLPEDFPRRIYVTFDVDCFDASLMPATGTPSPGGLFWHDALALVERCCEGRHVVGLDVTELAPLPHLHHADFTAAKLAHALMGIALRGRAHGKK